MGRETDREWGGSIQMDATLKSAWTRLGFSGHPPARAQTLRLLDPNGSQGCHHKGCWLLPIVLNQGFLSFTLGSLRFCNHQPIGHIGGTPVAREFSQGIDHRGRIIEVNVRQGLRR